MTRIDTPNWPTLRRLATWYRARSMQMALLALDDATLKDIGVYRCDIPHLVQSRFGRR